MYQVVQFAGMANESSVDEFPTLPAAREHMKSMYSQEEIQNMPVDITYNGSTEF